MAAERQEQDNRAKRLEIVTNRLDALATELEVELARVTTASNVMPQLFEFDDMVLSVRLFESVDDTDELNSTSPKLVVVQHYVSVVAIDRRLQGRSSIEQVRVGQLSWVNYDGIYRAITDAPNYLIFSKDRVLPALTPQQ